MAAPTTSEDGQIAYEALTNAQKAELAAYVRGELDGTSGPSAWRTYVQALIQQSLARRAVAGDPLDAGDVLHELMPQIRAAVPAEVREGLFRRVTSQLGP